MAFPTGWVQHKITIDYTKVSGPLTDFPVYLKSDNFLPGIWGSANSDGSDLRFSLDSAGGTVLDREVVQWGTASGTSGTAQVWVKLPSVSSTADTDFYVWFNNGTATNTSGTGVWSNGFQGIWHLQSAGTGVDSSYNSYNLTAYNTPTLVDGVVGSAVDFDNAGTQYMRIADASCPNLEISSDQTWATWVYFNSDTAGNQILISKRNGAESNQLYVTSSTGQVVYVLTGLTTNNQVTNTAIGTFTTGSWYLLAGRYNSTAGTLSLYVNGTIAEVEAGGTKNDSNADFQLSGRADTNGGVIDARLDESWVTNDFKSDDWLNTTRENMLNAATFSTPSVSATTYNRSILDNIGITDTLIRTAEFFREDQNTVGLTDSLDSAAVYLRSPGQDTVGLTDYFAYIVAVTRSLFDDMGITDNVERLVGFSRNMVNTIGLTDTVLRTVNSYRDITDNVGLTDSLVFQVITDYVRNLSDSIGITDSLISIVSSPDVFTPTIEFYQIDTVVPEIEGIDENIPPMYDVIDG